MTTSIPATSARVAVEKLEIAAAEAHARLMNTIRDLPMLHAMWVEYTKAQAEAFSARRALRELDLESQ